MSFFPSVTVSSKKMFKTSWTCRRTQFDLYTCVIVLLNRQSYTYYFSPISAMVNSLTLMRPDLGEISFLKEFPIWAAANGSRPWQYMYGVHESVYQEKLLRTKILDFLIL